MRLSRGYKAVCSLEPPKTSPRCPHPRPKIGSQSKDGREWGRGKTYLKWFGRMIAVPWQCNRLS